MAAVAAESGQILWAREISSYVGVSADWNSVYTVRDNGEIVSLTRRDGNESWRDASLLYREPTLPVAFDTTVVVGDLEGYLHFFSNLDGEPQARVKFGGKAISNAPVVMANRLYVQNDDGTVACFIIDRPKPQRDAPDIADGD
jgi:outer membrane protein assembly factor BamB